MAEADFRKTGSANRSGASADHSADLNCSVNTLPAISSESDFENSSGTQFCSASVAAVTKACRCFSSPFTSIAVGRAGHQRTVAAEPEPEGDEGILEALRRSPASAKRGSKVGHRIKRLGVEPLSPRNGKD